MKLLSLLTAALLPLASLAAKKPASDRFADFHAKQLAAGGAVKLSDTSYDRLTKAPRDYSVAVLLTVTGGIGRPPPPSPPWLALTAALTLAFVAANLSRWLAH